MGRDGFPLPREHGAWMMLYAPLVTGLVSYRVASLPAALLLLAGTSLFFAQNALGLQLRGRAGAHNGRWLVLFVLLGAAAGVGLLALGQWPLLPLALPALALVAVQAWRRRATRRQIDHSTANELLSVGVMSLGAVAACLAAGRPWTIDLLLPWGGFMLYFGGSVLYVKMRVGDARRRMDTDRRRAGLPCVGWHAAFLLAALIWGLRTDVGVWPVAAAVPPVLRAWIPWQRLNGSIPSLRRLGFTEVGISLWFCAFFGLSLAADSR